MTKLFKILTLIFVFVMSHSAFADSEGCDFNAVPYEPVNVCNSTPLSSPCEGSPTLGSVGLWVDQYFSPTIGAENFIALWRGYELLDDCLIPSTAGDTSGYMIAARTGKFLVENLVMASTTMVAQHEIFGHGFRAREFGIPVYKYRINIWSGYTSFDGAKYLQLSPSEKLAFAAGGMEADSIFARQLRDKWLNTKCMDVREANLYFQTTLDQTRYILRTNSNLANGIFSSNDVGLYIKEVNNWFGYTALTHKTLRKGALFDFLDPFLFYSLYSMGLYVGEGTQQFEYPMIPLGECLYLPSMRLTLAPYWPEYYLQNYFKTPERVVQITLKYGNTGKRQSYGLGLYTTKLWYYELLSFDGKFDVWVQPKLFTQKAARTRQKLGAALSVIAHYRIVPQLEIMAQVGYKTTGFLPGEVLKHSPILRIGFGAFF